MSMAFWHAFRENLRICKGAFERSSPSGCPWRFCIAHRNVGCALLFLSPGALDWKVLPMLLQIMYN